jgi:hypothetical protein
MIKRAIRMDKKRLVKKILKQCSLNHRRLRNSKRKLTFVSPVWATECVAPTLSAQFRGVRDTIWGDNARKTAR